MNKKSPVLFVIFNRPDITERVFSAIRQYQPDKLYIAADGPRKGRENEAKLCKETRDIVKKIDWNCDVKTLFRDKNVGCGVGVSSAITWLFEHEEYGIILEDDCLPDSSFFPYCEELLVRYKDDKVVLQISGTNLQNGRRRGSGSYYFSYYPGIWGWATWRRSWQLFDHNFDNLDETFKSGKLDHVFQTKSEKLFWLKKFRKSKKIVHDTWANYWLYIVWKNKGMGITPNQNLILNIGFENTGTHVFLRDSIREPQINGSIKLPLNHPPKMIERSADNYLYENGFSHSIVRILRLLKENGILTILKYLFYFR